MLTSTEKVNFKGDDTDFFKTGTSIIILKLLEVGGSAAVTTVHLFYLDCSVSIVITKCKSVHSCWDPD